jgi:hypothetical protein
MVQVFTVVYYAPYVEFGHRTASGRYVAAQPFFRPAYEQTYQVIIELLRRELANVA